MRSMVEGAHGGGEPAGGEGALPLSRFGDHHQHPFHSAFIENISRGDTHHANIALGEPTVAPEVMMMLFRQVVMRSVDLDRQLSFRAEEVEHIRSNWMLPPEAQPVQASPTQALPKQHLRQGQFAAQALRTLECQPFRPHLRAPSTMLRTVPLPRKRGRIIGDVVGKRNLIDKNSGKKRMRLILLREAGEGDHAKHGGGGASRGRAAARSRPLRKIASLMPSAGGSTSSP